MNRKKEVFVHTEKMLRKSLIFTSIFFSETALEEKVTLAFGFKA